MSYLDKARLNQSGLLGLAAGTHILSAILVIVDKRKYTVFAKNDTVRETKYLDELTILMHQKALIIVL